MHPFGAVPEVGWFCLRAFFLNLRLRVFNALGLYFYLRPMFLVDLRQKTGIDLPDEFIRFRHQTLKIVVCRRLCHGISPQSLAGRPALSIAHVIVVFHACRLVVPAVGDGLRERIFRTVLLGVVFDRPP